VLRTCCENVANADARNIQHQEFFFSPPPCCDYIAVMLRPVLLATSNIRSLFSLLLDTTANIKCLQHRNTTSAALKNYVCNTNNTCLQHRDSTSAASKINGCNIQHQGPFPPRHNTCLRHQNSTSTTSKINVHNIKNMLKVDATSATFENK
jgi:hypothetical protein